MKIKIKSYESVIINMYKSYETCINKMESYESDIINMYKSYDTCNLMKICKGYSINCLQLAEGLEKYRNDSCINIWNIHHKPGNELGDRQRYSSSHSDVNSTIHIPYVEIGGKS